jgi:hypothetical protein
VAGRSDTFVNIYGEEGPPSDPASVETSPIVPVTVTVTKDAMGEFAPLKEARVYRTPTGSTIADYFFTVPVSLLTVADGAAVAALDDTRAELLSEPIASTNWYPPDQALQGLMTLPNGILCAWKGVDLFFSEAYKPWAWPPAYAKPLINTIVGGIAHGSGAVVTTTSSPYIVSGSAPDAMTTSLLNAAQAGVGRASIAVVDGLVLFASHDGIVTVNGATASLDASMKWFTREVWRGRYGAALATMAFSVWDGRLVAFSTEAAFAPFMLRLDEAAGTMTDLPELKAAAAFVSPLTDQMYYVNGKAVSQFNGGPALTATWRSGDQGLPNPLNFAIAQADVAGAWTVEIYAYARETDEFKPRHTKTLASGVTTFRLPSGFESDSWRVHLSGTGQFKHLTLAQSGRELAKV